VRSLPGWWKVVAAEPIPDGLAVLIAGGAGERLPPPPTDTPAEVLVATLGPLLAAPEVAGTAPTAGLPLTEIPAAVPGRMLAIIYSGDGGWRDIDKQIGGVLAENGVAVVGVDSLRYFWHEKPPDVIARDLAGIIDDYGRRWNRDEVILVGYSFGAGVLPAAINRLPAAVRDAVVEVSLLGLGAQTTFQIQVAAWFGAAPRRVTAAVLPEVVRLDLTRVQCVYGMDEDDTLCRRPELAGAEVVRTAGGHHFDGDYQALARRILDGARRRVRR
jgi:type IV secretory pathway VirJ component